MKRFFAIVLVMAMMLSLCGCDMLDYKKAVKLMEQGSYDEAYNMFVALGDYKDSSIMALESQYRKALELMEPCTPSNPYLSEAIGVLESLGNYMDSAKLLQEACYQLAKGLMENGSSSKEFLDAAKYLEKAAPSALTSALLSEARSKALWHYVMENGESYTNNNGTEYHYITLDNSSYTSPRQNSNVLVQIYVSGENDFLFNLEDSLSNSSATLDYEMELSFAVSGDEAYVYAQAYTGMKILGVNTSVDERSESYITISTAVSGSDFRLDRYQKKTLDINGKTSTVTSYSEKIMMDNAFGLYPELMKCVQANLETMPFEISIGDLGFTAMYNSIR